MFNNKKTPKEDILIPNENVPEYTDINELSCLLGIKPLMKVIHGDSYVNKAELVKFSQDHTQQIDIVNTCVL